MAATIRVCFLILLISAQPVFAFADDWDDFVEYLSSIYDDDNTLDAHLETLEQIYLAPLNVNVCSPADLEQLSFLSPEQIDDIVYYVTRVKGMKAMDELVLIRSLDFSARRWLPLFLYVGDYPSAKPKLRFKDGRHEVLSSVDVPLYLRSGYTTADADRRYQGSRIAHRLKYRYQLANRLSVGFVLDKDQGEPIGSPFSLGYDFVGGHVMLRNVRRLQTLVVGDYHIGFGEGLLINRHFSMGKNALTMRRRQGIAAKTSCGETGFMRGAAASVALSRHLSATAFLSYLLMDATVNGSNGMVSSLSMVSTHRNMSELHRYHNTSELSYGAHVEYRDSLFHLGATAYESTFHLPFYRGDEAYREFYPEGRRFYGVSLDYGLCLGAWTANGETATNGSGWATLNRVAYRYANLLLVELSGRYYSPAYHSFHSRALSEWSVQNETGGCLCVQAMPCRRLHLSLCADVFHSPHVRYQISHPSTGEELRLTMVYDFASPSKQTSLSSPSMSVLLRASLKRKEQYDVMYRMQRYTARWSWRNNAFSMSSQAAIAHYSNAAARRSFGYSFQQVVRWQNGSDFVRLAASAAYFDTDDYYSRMYLSEPTIIGASSSSMFYGQGLHLAATVRLNVCRYAMVMLRYSFNRYFDRNTIGSDLQLIPHPYQNDLSLQCRLNF